MAEGIAAYGSYSPGHWSKTDDESTIPPSLFLPRRRDRERGTVDGGRILPIPSARSGPPSPPTCPERGCSLPGRAARCTSAAVYLMLIPASSSAAAESALLLLLDRKGTEEKSSNRFGRTGGWMAAEELSGDAERDDR